MREGAYDYLHKPFRPDEVTDDHPQGRRARAAPPRGRGRCGRAWAPAWCRTWSSARATGDARPARAGEPGGAPPHHGAHHRRERHRQGGAGPRHPPDEPAERAELHRDQLRRDSRSSCSSPSCSATCGRVHRRHRRPGGLFELAARGHAAARRDRRPAARPPGQAAAGVGGRRDPAGRRTGAAAGGRAGHRRHRQAARAGGREGASSAPTCSTASTSCASTCRPCASGRRTCPRC